MKLSVIIYNAAIRCYAFVIFIAALFNAKANAWISGRKNIFDKIKSKLLPGEKRIWVHCASLGEFEQGRPVIEKIKVVYPSVKIVLTFFSPSGYNIQKNYAGADYIFYLPLDTRQNAKKFISLINPSLVLFIKYEFWYYYLSSLKSQNIPVILVSAIFRREQVFFRWYGILFRKMLACYDHIFLQTIAAEKLLLDIGINNITVAGDTRSDRVLSIAEKAKSFPEIENLLQGRRAFVAGSTWPEDENLLAQYFNLQQIAFPVIIAPHEIGQAHLKKIEQLFNGDIIRYSQLQKTNNSHCSILIIDNIGMLSSLYQYGFAAYIGGGFHHGIHNILEAAAFGLPVIFGPRYHQFNEATELIATGAAFPVKNVKDFSEKIMYLQKAHELQQASANASQYVKNRAGATSKIMDYIQAKRILT